MPPDSTWGPIVGGDAVKRDPEEWRPADLRAEAVRLRRQAEAARGWWAKGDAGMIRAARTMAPGDYLAIRGATIELDAAAHACERLAELHERLVLEPKRALAARRRLTVPRRPEPAAVEPDADEVLERYRRQREAVAEMGAAAADAIISGPREPA